MVSSIKRETFTLAISLLFMVISLTEVAVAGPPPTSPVFGTALSSPGFAGTPGKMAQDASGNIYVTDFAGQRLLKYSRKYNLDPATGQQTAPPTVIPLPSRPVGVCVTGSQRLVVSMQAPKTYVAIYNLDGTNEQVITPPTPWFRPSAITVDDADNIYVLEMGDLGVWDDPSIVYGTGTHKGVAIAPTAGFWPKVQVFRSSDLANIGTIGEGRWDQTDQLPMNANAGRFLEPMGMEFEATKKEIYVADTLLGRIQVFGAQTNADATRRLKLMNDPIKDPTGTLCVPAGTVANRIAYCKIFGPIQNTTSTEIPSPQGIAFQYYDNAGTLALGRIFVADRSRDKVVVYSPDLTTINGRLTNTTTEFTFPADVLYANGNLVTASAATGTPSRLVAVSLDGGPVPPNDACGIHLDPVPHNVTGSFTITGTVDRYTTCGEVRVKVNAAADVTLTVNGNGTWSYVVPAPPLVAGDNTIIAKGQVTGDPANYMNDATAANHVWMGTVSTTPPLLTLTSAASYVTAPSFTFTGSATKSATGYPSLGFGVDIWRTDTDKGAPQTGTLTSIPLSGAGQTINWTNTMSLAEGVNYLCAQAWQAGNSSSAVQCIQVVSDSTFPVIGSIMSFIPDNSTATKATVNLTGTVTELFLKDITVSVNGDTDSVYGKYGKSGGLTLFSAPVTLRRGANTVVVSAVDLSGNLVSNTMYANFNPDLPEKITVTSADNTTVNGVTSVTLTGTVTKDPAAATYPNITVSSGNGTQTMLAAGGAWSLPCTIQTNLVDECDVIVAPAGLGGVSKLNRTYSFDTTRGFAITSPVEDIPVTATSVAVTGTNTSTGVTGVTAVVIDPNGAQVSPAPTVTRGTSTTYSFTASLGTAPVEGVYAIKVTFTEPSLSYTAIRNVVYYNPANKPLLTAGITSLTNPTEIVGMIGGSSSLSCTATPTAPPLSYDLPVNPANIGVVFHADMTGRTGLSCTTTNPAGVTNSTFPVLPIVGNTNANKMGDLNNNGMVDMQDVNLCLRHVAGFAPLLTGAALAKADVGPAVTTDSVQGLVYAAPNGTVTLADCLEIQRVEMGIDTFINQ